MCSGGSGVTQRNIGDWNKRNGESSVVREEVLQLIKAKGFDKV